MAGIYSINISCYNYIIKKLTLWLQSYASMFNITIRNPLKVFFKMKLLNMKATNAQTHYNNYIWLVFLGSMVKAFTFCAFWVWVSISWIITIWWFYDLCNTQFVGVHAFKVFHSISPLVPSLKKLINVAWNYYFINTQHINLALLPIDLIHKIWLHMLNFISKHGV